MEKLQPVIAHKFWIFFALALLLPTIGWWMGTGELIAEIEEQEKTIEGKFNAIPSGEKPNQTWAEEAKEINEIEQMKLDQATALLQKTQQGLRVWPKEIAHLMQDVPYRGEVELTTRGSYAYAYFNEIERLRQIVDPFDPTTNQGKVILDAGAIPSVARDHWKYFHPSSEEMWNKQEDIWLIEELLRSIDEVNQNHGAKTITEAPVRRIMEIVLKGGDLSARDQKADTGTGGDGGVEVDAALPAFSRGGNFGGPGRGGQRNRIGVDFPLAEEFGPATLQGSDGGPAAEGGAEPPAGPTGGPGGGRGKKKEKRYVDDDPALPYKTRGFKLKLVIDHRKLPDLLAALTNSKWPVRVARVHQVAYNREGGGGAGIGDMQARAAGAVAGGGALGEFDAADPAFNEPALPAGRSRRQGGSAAAAMADPYLATVAIAGLMTMYNPPAPEEQPEGEPSGNATPTTPTGEPASETNTEAAPSPPQSTQNTTKATTDPTSEGPAGQSGENQPTPATAKPKESEPKLPGTSKPEPSSATGSPAKPSPPAPEKSEAPGAEKKTDATAGNKAE